MTDFVVTGPDGKKYQIAGPEGATEADAIAMVQRQLGGQAQEPKKEEQMSWADVGSQALQNAPGSAYKFGEDIVSAIAHPIETAKNVGSVIAGGVQKAGQAAGLPG